MQKSTASIHSEVSGVGSLTLSIEGSLDSTTTGRIWHQAMEALLKKSSKRLIVDASNIDYCDGSGVGLLIELHRRQKQTGGELEIRGLKPEFQKLLDLFDPSKFEEPPPEKPKRIPFPEEVGRKFVSILEELRSLVAFLGELFVAMLYSLFHPRSVRWKDAFIAAEKSGVNALPIIALVSFLVGLIIAFQSAIPMRAYGAEVFIANLTVLSMFRELGPLMTAIILAGRSGSAFAAEIGTMKVREEIDALTTMALEPVKFLVVTRLSACMFLTPLLTVFANIFGVIGGGIVFVSLGFPLPMYFNKIVEAASYGDFLGGLFKAFIFGFLVAGVGCFEGLRTKTGASAVGDSATRAVVIGIVLIILTDGLFSTTFYYLGI